MCYKLLCNEKYFDEVKFKEDLGGVFFSIVFGVEELNEKLDIFNFFFKFCFDRYVFLCRIKIIWLFVFRLNEEEIRKL